MEYLCNENNKIRTLFATHYHELTSLEGSIPGVKNLKVDVTEENGNIVFLHKIISGSASRSYGIHVAQIAGVPKTVLEAAQNKLTDLESGKYDGEGMLAFGSNVIAEEGEHKDLTKGKGKKLKQSESSQEELQLSLFSFAPNPVIDRLKSLDLMKLAPWEALKILGELQEAAND